jgi:hypothetical protein
MSGEDSESESEDCGDLLSVARDALRRDGLNIPVGTRCCVKDNELSEG